VQHLHNTKELSPFAIPIVMRAVMNEILVLSTTDTLDLAQKIASALVREHEAACVNIVPGIRSVYYWEGKECNDQEFLLLIKSSMERFEAIRARIRQLHSYKVPEILALPITAGDPSYLAWISERVGVKG
jgi:periplasmic divalent cation tolerance protein